MTVEPTGDCYPTAWRLVTTGEFADDPTARLVHGRPVGRGPIEGVRYDHAWVETTQEVDLSRLCDLPGEGRVIRLVSVVDRSNGLDLPALPRDLYYLLGNVDEDDVRRYTRSEAAALGVDTGHYGPWTA